MPEAPLHKAVDPVGLARQLFGAGRDERPQVFAVLDGAANPRIVEAIAQHEPLSVCLYRGETSPVIRAAAPWLVQLEPYTAFTEWLIAEGWGRAWGIFAQTRGDMLAMRLHFRRLLTVSLPDGREVFFRFYDPRVLRAHLPTCKPRERATMFGAVDAYLLEGERPAELIRFADAPEALSQVRIPLGG
jgi:hypothetical protein